MTARLLLVLALLCLPTPGQAHRLDEYLQATTITLAHDKVTLRLALTPGVAVAPAVLVAIDRNGDGGLSPTEQRRYAEGEARDLRLTVDGRAVSLRLASWGVADTAALRGGAGDIVLTLEAPIGLGRVHRLALDRNVHDPAVIYLVNTLVPTDPRLAVTGQERSADQSSYAVTFSVDGAAATSPPAVDEDRAAIATTFFGHGIRHILTGYDHLLFVAALVLGAGTLWDLVKVVTAFTLAHSLTLALAVLGLVTVPAALVEPVIAASIVAVALGNLTRPDRRTGRARLALAYGFGLFHGLGFAGGLLDAMHAMPRGATLLAISGFGLGVEVGNQLVVIPLFLATRLISVASSGSMKGLRSTLIRQAGSSAIAAVGSFYLALALFAV